MKKKIIIGSAIVLAIIGYIFGYFFIRDIVRETKLLDEVDEIDNVLNTENANLDEVEEKLERTVSKGEYAMVERAYKNYISDFLKNMKNIAQVLNEEQITQSLTVENYKTDGPDFTKTKEYLTSTIQKLEDYKNEYKEFLTQGKAMEYIENDLDKHYIEFYKDEMVGEIEEDTTVEDSMDEVINLLKYSEDVIDFLVKNKGKWQIDGENIVFESQELSDEYTKLIDKVIDF